MSCSRTRIYSQHSGQTEIEVWQEGKYRLLTFDGETAQSQIDITNPTELASPSCQALLSALMFIEEPHNVLLLGTGGGAIARYFHHRTPQIQGVAVEHSEAVAKIAREYFDFPPQDSNWQLIIEDVRSFVQHNKQLFDLIVLDISEKAHPPEWISSPAFLQNCKDCLSPTGVLSINLIPQNADSFKNALWNIRQAFDRKTLCLSVQEHQNIITLAFTTQPPYRSKKKLLKQIPALTNQWGLTFETFLKQFEIDNPSGSGIF